MSPALRRLDAELVARKLADSRNRAQELIRDKRVRVNGSPSDKPARQVRPEDRIELAADGVQWASRGAHKLIGALDHFEAAGLQPMAGRAAMDAGASTGGFTDVLLSRGAVSVIAVDVGYGQLVWRLRSDPRVTVLDRTNVRHLRRDALTDLVGSLAMPDVIVADLSFISLGIVLPALADLVAPDGDLLLMVKPQFEVGRDNLGPRGVVRDPGARVAAISGVLKSARGLGWGCRGVVASPLPGPNGNVEYFVWLQRGEGQVAEDEVVTAVKEGPQ